MTKIEYQSLGRQYNYDESIKLLYYKFHICVYNVLADFIYYICILVLYTDKFSCEMVSSDEP